MERAGARGEEALMPFVQGGDEGGGEQCHSRPNHRPVRVSSKGNAVSPAAIDQQAQEPVSEDVPRFAKREIDGGKLLKRHSEEMMKQGKENSAGVRRREQVGGFESDDAQPEECRQPSSNESAG